MNNYLKDTPEIESRLSCPLVRRIAGLRERDFADSAADPCAPENADGAMENYLMLLELAGELAATDIAAASASVDYEGTRCENGRAVLPEALQDNLRLLHQAGLSGMTLPREYGGLNMPFSVFCAVSEMIARADASFQNVWGLQACADTILEFGTEEQKRKYLPMVCAGASMSMDLTEPGAGSDLQSVTLRATEDTGNGCWRLDGVKRFITNGDSDIHLVLARSEEGTSDGRGLSLFIYDRRDGGVEVRRVEDKMGLHGSPTCELVFRNARAELCGVRRMGLIKYVMSLMNGARLGIAAQSVGLCDAAWREAVSYASVRCQFGHPISEFPAVAQMLATMKARLEASRSLLYRVAGHVDLCKALDIIAAQGQLSAEQKAESRSSGRMADALTPLAKFIVSEFANQNAYDCVQVHGGSGYMYGYRCERIYRDARVTSIYEGTSQMQVVAALRYVMNGTYSRIVSDLLETMPESAPVAGLKEMSLLLDRSVGTVASWNSQEMTDYCSRRLVEISALCITAALLAADASASPELLSVPCSVFLKWAGAQVVGHGEFIRNFTTDNLTDYRRYSGKSE